MFDVTEETERNWNRCVQFMQVRRMRFYHVLKDFLSTNENVNVYAKPIYSISLRREFDCFLFLALTPIRMLM